MTRVVDSRAYDAVGDLAVMKAKGEPTADALVWVRRKLEQGWRDGVPGLPDREATLRELDEDGPRWVEALTVRRHPRPEPVDESTAPPLGGSVTRYAREAAERSRARVTAYLVALAPDLARAREALVALRQRRDEHGAWLDTVGADLGRLAVQHHGDVSALADQIAWGGRQWQDAPMLLGEVEKCERIITGIEAATPADLEGLPDPEAAARATGARHRCPPWLRPGPAEAQGPRAGDPPPPARETPLEVQTVAAPRQEPEGAAFAVSATADAGRRETGR